MMEKRLEAMVERKTYREKARAAELAEKM